MTDATFIDTLKSIAGDLIVEVKKTSLAYQIADYVPNTGNNPYFFGVKKNPSTTGFSIAGAQGVKTTLANKEGYTQEVLEDIFNLYGKDANDILRVIAANDISEQLDEEILAYLKGIATVGNSLTIDFTSEPEWNIMANNIVYKISKERMLMASILKRGLPKNLIVSNGIAAVLVGNRVIGLAESEEQQENKSNTRYLGKIGDLNVYSDYASETDYFMITHKSSMPGDASLQLTDVGLPIICSNNNEDTGQPKIHLQARFAYSRNPKDTTGENDSLFVTMVPCTVTGFASL